jgi:hypothetical protein
VLALVTSRQGCHLDLTVSSNALDAQHLSCPRVQIQSLSCISLHTNPSRSLA